MELRAYKIVRTSSGPRLSYTISLCVLAENCRDARHSYRKTILEENHHDSGNGRERKRRKNCLAGSGEKRSETSCHVPIGGGSSESARGNRNGDSGLQETGNAGSGVARRGERVSGVFADSGTGAAGIEHDRSVRGCRRETCGAEFGAGRGRLRQIVSWLASESGRQIKADAADVDDSAAEFVSPERGG